MRDASLWSGLLGVDRVIVERVVLEGADVVAHVRPHRSRGWRCGVCGRRARLYDRGRGRRRWRGLDLGTMRVLLEADAPRVDCRVHGPTVRQMPWARHGAGHCYSFDQQVAWLATQCSKTAVCELMRIAWRTVGAIITRVWRDTAGRVDLLAGLRRIGIDEISYKRNHKYITVVVDHDTGHLVWAGEGKGAEALDGFFTALGPLRCSDITHVSADGANWISNSVTRHCPAAVRCADPFHVVRWATVALDEVRREAWNAARADARTNQQRRNEGKKAATTTLSRALRGARFALLKNPENLTVKQTAKLDWIARSDPRLHRAYLLKEGLRLIFQLPPDEAPHALEHWIGWARRSRIELFVKLQRTIIEHRDSILAAITHQLSNGRLESVNTKIRLITRIGFGFHSPQALISLAMLNLAGHKPALPGRT